MKNNLLTIVIFSLIFISCSKDSNEELDLNADCENTVWGLSNSNGNYYVEYGPDQDHTKTIPINEETFKYYIGIVEDDNEEDCWEGVK